MAKKKVGAKNASVTVDLETSSPSLRFANGTLELTRTFIQALLQEESFAAAIREQLEKQGRPHTYLSMDEKMAKVLYAILKLQHHFLRQPTKGDEVRHFPQADRKNIARFTNLTEDQIRPIIYQLRAARYVLLGNLRRVHGAEEARVGEGHEIYELDVPVVVSCADTATFLLELLEEARKNVQENLKLSISKDLGPRLEIDGKVNRAEFVLKLLDAKKLGYFSKEDLLGSGWDKGKIDQVTDAGEYIERVSATHIRPRMRIVLERPYLALVARQIPLEELNHYYWSSGRWHESQGKDHPLSNTSSPS